MIQLQTFRDAPRDCIGIFIREDGLWIAETVEEADSFRQLAVEAEALFLQEAEALLQQSEAPEV